jgi:hypothetical protein
VIEWVKLLITVFAYWIQLCLIAFPGVNTFIFFACTSSRWTFYYLQVKEAIWLIQIFFITLEFQVQHDSTVIGLFLSSWSLSSHFIWIKVLR